MTAKDQKQKPPRESESIGAPSAITWDASEFPWWLVAMVAIIIAMGVAILTNEEYGNAFDAIFPVPLKLAKGMGLTLILTGASFIISVFAGLVIALLRMAQYKGWRWYWHHPFGLSALLSLVQRPGLLSGSGSTDCK